MSNDSRRVVLRALFRDISLTQQALYSYDDFKSRVVNEIISSNNIIKVKSQLVEDAPMHVIKFSNIVYKNASIVEKNGDVRPLNASTSRTRDLTFSAPMYVDIEYKVANKPSTYLRSKYIGRMPIMVRSSLSPDNTDECDMDPGGYFIINGNEKTIVVQERVLPNLIMCFKTSHGSISTCHSCSNKFTNSYNALKISGGLDTALRVDFNGVSQSIPIFSFLKALGATEKMIVERLKPSEIEYDIWYKDDAPIKNTTEWFLSKSKNKSNPAKSLAHCIYPHLGTDTYCSIEKLETAFEQAEVLLRCLKGQRKYDSRDNTQNKRMDTAGIMMGSLLATLWQKFLEEITRSLQKLLDRNKTVKIERLINTTTLTDGLKYALATGNWRTKDITSGRVGVSQPVNRNTYIASISQLRRVDSNVDADQKIITPRLLSGDQWGFTCPSETPEGGPCGLVKQLALSTRISTQSYNKEIDKINFDGTKTPVYRNGAYVGRTDHYQKLIKHLKRLRKNRLIASDVSISYKDYKIYIWEDAGRVYRPVFVAHNGKILLTNSIAVDLKMGRTKFDYLYQLGIIENIDAFETETCYIGLEPDDLTPAHTHCELHPSMILGTLASTIPFPDHNQSPRNTYQAAMGKQAMGIYSSKFLERYDTTGHILNYPQKPLVTTESAKNLNGDMLPSGHNAIVAIMCYGGYNQEDSILVNKAAVDRGFGRSTTYRTLTGSTVTRGQGYHCFKRPTKNEVLHMRDEKCYSCLDDDGLPPPGVNIKNKQAVIGRLTKNKHAEVVPNTGRRLSRAELLALKPKDASVFHKKSDGVVDDTLIFQNDQGGQTAKIRVREMKIPELGDKFSSRHGQKGTIGMLYPQEDLPFTQDGIVPDIIVNPHAIPSRMTIGHITECLAGKLAALTGKSYIDATAFEHNPVQYFIDELRKAGYNPYGNEQLYHGATGEPLAARVFIGPTYYQKLKHMVGDKIHARSRGKIVGLTRQPNEGRAHGGGLRWGEMERDVGISHGASHVLHERMLLSSDAYEAPVCKNCGLIGGLTTSKSIYSNTQECKQCTGMENTIRKVTMPYVTKLMFQELMSMGINPKLNIKDESLPE